MIFCTKNTAIIGLAVALVAFMVYVNSLDNGFVWDDDVVIVNNRALKGNALSLFSLLDTSRDSEPAPYYRPLTLLSFMIDYRVHRLTPFLVRLVSLLLHAANTFLVYQLLCVLLKKSPAALLAALLFAVHPLHTEAVDLNAARNTLLATFFVLSSLLVHERSTRLEKRGWVLGGAVLFLAGLFSKEPALLVLPFICFLEIKQTCSRGIFQFRQVFVRLFPYLCATFIYFVLRHNALLGSGVNIGWLTGVGPRLLDNIYIIPRYLVTVLWPVRLSPMYFVPDDFHPLALQLAFAWFGIMAVLVWCLTRGRSLATLFGVSWLILFWLPVSGIVPIASAQLADRYLYLPAIGLWLIVADQLSRFIAVEHPLRTRFILVTVIILCILAAITMRRNMDWKNDITLFSRCVELYPDQAFGYHNLGCAYLDKFKNIELAEQSFEKALALDANFPRLQTQMGYIRMQRSDYEGALQLYAEALKRNPYDAEAHLNSGAAFEKLGRYTEALFEYKRFLETPGNEFAEARLNIPEKVTALTQRLDAVSDGWR